MKRLALLSKYKKQTVNGREIEVCLPRRARGGRATHREILVKAHGREFLIISMLSISFRVYEIIPVGGPTDRTKELAKFERLTEALEFIAGISAGSPLQGARS
jgi:hypothetical protein